MYKRVSGLAIVFGFLLNCLPLLGATNYSPSSLRPLKKSELKADFKDLTDSVERLYGPYEYKERRFGYKIKELGKEYGALLSKATSEEEAIGVFAQYLTRFQDGHVSLHVSPSGRADYMFKTLTLIVTPVGDEFYVESVDPSLSREIGIGDKLVSVDGVETRLVVKEIAKYKSLGNELSDRFLSIFLFMRPAFMTSLRPKDTTVKLEFESFGSKYVRDLTWIRQDGSAFNPTLVEHQGARQNPIAVASTSPLLREMAFMGLSSIGKIEPIFLSASVKSQLARVTLDAEAMASHRVTLEALNQIYAAQYRFSEKTILLIRQPSYSPNFDDLGMLVRAYEAILQKFGPLSDVVVIDQTHNPGGSVDYVHNLFQIYAKGEQPNVVQFFNADRAWLTALKSWTSAIENHQSLLMKALEQLITEAINGRKRLIRRPVGFDGKEWVSGKGNYILNGKPILVLIDEVAGSGGDAFPMLMQRSGRAKLFGQRTMGLGGNVEMLPPLPNSGTFISLTRGLFTSYDPKGLDANGIRQGSYADDKLIENNGITPDILYVKTISDVSAGYWDYFTAFSKAAVELTERPAGSP